MLVFDLSANPILLLFNSILDFLCEMLLQVLQLLLVIISSLLKGLGEGALLGLLVADCLAQLLRFTLHLVLVGSFLDVWVIAFLILPCFLVHLLQTVPLGVRIGPCPRRPIDIVNLSKSPLCVFDRPDDLTILVSCAAKANRHTLSIEPSQNASQDSVDRTQGREDHTRGLLVRRKTGQGCGDKNLQQIEEGNDVVRHAVQDTVPEILAESAIVQASVAPTPCSRFGWHKDVVHWTCRLCALVFRP